MKKKVPLSFYAAVLCAAFAFADVPNIRFTAEAPFDADGRRVESVWKGADTCVRFVKVVTMDAAIDQSEAQLLFDDRNLYVSLTGFFNPKYARGLGKDKSQGAVNNFEFLIRPDGMGEVHVIVDEFARLYVARNKSQVHDSGVVARIDKGKGRWTANGLSVLPKR